MKNQSLREIIKVLRTIYDVDQMMLLEQYTVYGRQLKELQNFEHKIFL